MRKKWIPKQSTKFLFFRVMAARSPNISLISSISQKLVDTKLKARPPTKLSATPDLKAKQSFDELKAPQILIHLEVFETQKQQLLGHNKESCKGKDFGRIEYACENNMFSNEEYCDYQWKDASIRP
ncbi:hypothetical protein CFP56_031122 [Quercus suber]|uniref:Uncharacterized protein n=1 Tax=Quercus suber TaxID=58331 RepID=A0AAW0JMP7_QUESU